MREPKERKYRNVSFLGTAADVAVFRAAAESHGLTVGEFMRAAADIAIRRAVVKQPKIAATKSR